MEDYLAMHRPGCFEKYGSMRMVALKRHNMFFPSTFTPMVVEEELPSDLEELNFDMLKITKLLVPANDQPDFLVTWDDGQAMWFRARNNEVRAIWVNGLYSFLALKQSLGINESFFPTFPVPLLFAKIIIECIDFIESTDSSGGRRTAVYQVMRKSATGKDVQALYWKLLENKGIPVNCDVHVVTNVLKPMLSWLPETVLTRGLYAKFMALAPKAGEGEGGSPEARNKLPALLQQLPTLNRLLLGRLMRLCAQLVADAKTNDLHASGLGVLLGPTILLSDDPFELRNLKKTAIPVLLVIIHQTIQGAIFSQQDVEKDAKAELENLNKPIKMADVVSSLRPKHGSIFPCLSISDAIEGPPDDPHEVKDIGVQAGKQVGELVGKAQNQAVSSLLAVLDPSLLQGYHEVVSFQESPGEELQNWPSGKSTICTFELEGKALKRYIESLPGNAVIVGIEVVGTKDSNGFRKVTSVVAQGLQLDLSASARGISSVKGKNQSSPNYTNLSDVSDDADSGKQEHKSDYGTLGSTQPKSLRAAGSGRSGWRVSGIALGLGAEKKTYLVSAPRPVATGKASGYPDQSLSPKFKDTQVTLVQALTRYAEGERVKKGLDLALVERAPSTWHTPLNSPSTGPRSESRTSSSLGSIASPSGASDHPSTNMISAAAFASSLPPHSSISLVSPPEDLVGDTDGNSSVSGDVQPQSLDSRADSSLRGSLLGANETQAAATQAA
eukprot:gb/GEZN01002703.1/.p1 GENE.gb/GEZN01002703.1/~~gb/GEZN01002703.1/.p1  ORF type:complete len:726 (-),score=141.54 gb/GEZN01002703.1/:118-2295(-)